MDGTEFGVEDPTTREEMEKKKEAVLYLAESRKTKDPSERAMWYGEAMAADPQEVRDAQRVMGIAGLFRRKAGEYKKLREKNEKLKERSDRLEAENLDLTEMAHVDHLTKLFNRRKYDSDLTRYVWEMEKGKRAGEAREPISAIYMDIDNFGPFNEYGNEIGDKVLASIGRIIRSETGESGNAYRCGGEELMVLMPNTKAEDACRLAERIRKTVEAQKFDFTTKSGEKKSETLTISAGVSSIGELGYPKAMNWIYADKGFVTSFFGSIKDEKKRAAYSEIEAGMNKFFSDPRYMGRETSDDVFKEYGRSLRGFDPIFRDKFHIELMSYALFSRANMAEEQSKHTGKNRVHVYSAVEDRYDLYSHGAAVKPRFKKDTLRLVREMEGKGNQNP